MILLLILSLIVPVLFLGCSGDDGSAGAAGAAGSSTLAAVTTEPAGANCANGGQKMTTGVDDNRNGILDPAEVDSTQYVCNDAGSEFSASQRHAITGQVDVNNVVVTPIVGGVTVAFDVTVDGVPFNGFPFLFRAYEYAASATAHATYTGTDNVIYPVVNDFTRTTVTASSTIASIVGGRYTVTVNDPPPADNVVTYLVTVGIDNTETQPAATPAGPLTTPVRSIASSQACINCHGDNPLFREPNDDLTD